VKQGNYKPKNIDNKLKYSKFNIFPKNLLQIAISATSAKLPQLSPKFRRSCRNLLRSCGNWFETYQNFVRAAKGCGRLLFLGLTWN